MRKTIITILGLFLALGWATNASAASLNQQMKMQRTRIRKEGLLGIAGGRRSKNLHQDKKALRIASIAPIAKRQKFIGQKIKLVKLDTGNRMRKYESRNGNGETRGNSGNGNWSTQQRRSGNLLVNKQVISRLKTIDYAKGNARVPGRI